MKSTYQLIALDMDDTLLNSQKEITPVTEDAIHRAFAQGKDVVLCTGRSVSELQDYFSRFPEMRYAVCASGAGVYDISAGSYLHCTPIDWPLVETIFQFAQKRDVFPQIYMDGSPYLPLRKMDSMSLYGIAAYESLFRQVGILCEDPYDACRSVRGTMLKINFYHRSTEERLLSRQRLAGLPLELVDAEITGLELSPKGVDKGTGLTALCRHLKLPLSRTISVGDSFNDLPALQIAGLSVAVGNARETVKEACDVVVADCDHDGVAEVIDTYLLSD